MRIALIFLLPMLLAAQSPTPPAAAPPASAIAAARPAPAGAQPGGPKDQGDRSAGLPHASRSPVLGRNGMAATSQPLATQIAIDVLKRGGNAVDARERLGSRRIDPLLSRGDPLHKDRLRLGAPLLLVAHEVLHQT
jgi:hypothetical protein